MNSWNSHILLVEDDENDVFLMERAMAKAKLAPPMHVATNGQEAIDYMAGKGQYADRSKYPLPECVFLDLKLPFVHGFEVLEWKQEQPSLSHISVLVLTSSPEDRDRQRARQLGAKEYLVKPPTPEMLLQIMHLFPKCAPD
jgi:CheY-like chemotaxis protein